MTDRIVWMPEVGAYAKQPKKPPPQEPAPEEIALRREAAAAARVKEHARDRTVVNHRFAQ